MEENPVLPKKENEANRPKSHRSLILGVLFCSLLILVLGKFFVRTTEKPVEDFKSQGVTTTDRLGPLSYLEEIRNKFSAEYRLYKDDPLVWFKSSTTPPATLRGPRLIIDKMNNPEGSKPVAQDLLSVGRYLQEKGFLIDSFNTRASEIQLPLIDLPVVHAYTKDNTHCALEDLESGIEIHCAEKTDPVFEKYGKEINSFYNARPPYFGFSFLSEHDAGRLLDLFGGEYGGEFLLLREGGLLKVIAVSTGEGLVSSCDTIRKYQIPESVFSPKSVGAMEFKKCGVSGDEKKYYKNADEKFEINYPLRYNARFNYDLPFQILFERFNGDNIVSPISLTVEEQKDKKELLDQKYGYIEQTQENINGVSWQVEYKVNNSVDTIGTEAIVLSYVTEQNNKKYTLECFMCNAYVYGDVATEIKKDFDETLRSMVFLK